MIRSSSLQEQNSIYITELIGLSACTTSKGQKETEIVQNKNYSVMIFLDLIHNYFLRDDYQFSFMSSLYNSMDQI